MDKKEANQKGRYIIKSLATAVKLLFNKKSKDIMSSPETLEEAVMRLESEFNLLPKEEQEKLKNIKSSDDFAAKFHMFGGMSMRNNWGLWNEKSPLHIHFKKRFGIWHADDMSGMIFQCLWQKINGMNMTPYSFANYYHDYWERIQTKRNYTEYTTKNGE